MRLLAFEERWAQVAGRSLIPASIYGGLRGDIDFGAELRERARRYPIWTLSLLRAALWLLWFSPLWLLRRPCTFGSLPTAEREEVLEVLLDHRSYAVRQLVDLLKLVLCLIFLGNRELLTHLRAYDLGDPGPRP